MAPNFFSKLVKNSPIPNASAESTSSLSDDQGPTSPRSSTTGRPHAQTISYSASSRLSPHMGGEASESSSSVGSFKIGVIPPSPSPTPPDLSTYVTHRPSCIEQGHQASLQHRRVRSQDRHIPDRHEMSLAVRPASELLEDPQLTPTPSRPIQTQDWASSLSTGFSDGSPRQLSPASSTGNLKGFVDKHGGRTHTLGNPDKPVAHKLSKHSLRSATQPPPPLKVDQANAYMPSGADGSRHEDASTSVSNIIVESPTSVQAQKAQSHELLATLSDGDSKSVRSATSSGSKKRKDAGRRPSVGTPSRKKSLPESMNGPLPVPSLPASPFPPSGSKSTLSVNGTPHGHATPYSPRPAFDRRARSPNVSTSRSDFSDGDTFNSDSGSDDELDLNEQDIPVTGFAVASNKRNADFHELFPNIPEGDYLIEDYGCALQREILIQGRLYISENHICFHANIFGWITDLSIPIYEITGLEKRMTAFVIPNAIQITTRQAKYTFASLLSRDTTYDVIANVWRLARPEDSLELPDSQTVSTQDRSSALSLSDGSAKGGVPVVPKKVTSCDCSKNGAHLSELALETVLPGAPDKIYNLMFASGFIKDFMKVDQKLMDIQISDWAPISPGSKLLQRNMSYIKPLNNSVGPKQTKCEIHDEALHCDFDDYVVMLTSTRTPDVPSGGVFVVKTRTCLMWASSITTRVIVTTQVEWTGRSFIKGLIEKSVVDGQKVYHSALDKAIRMYIQEHQTEFIPEGVDPTAVAPVEPITPIAEANRGLEKATSDEEARKARERDRNRRGLQWAYETFEGAYNVGKRSTSGALELVREAWDQSSSTTILWFIIVLLVLSNLWTLVLVGNREEVGRRKEAKRAEDKERWLQGVVAGIWEELAAERSKNAFMVPSGPVGDVQMEMVNIGRALDAVEQRVKVIRESLEGLS